MTRVFKIALAALVFSACATTPRVSSRVADGVELTQYKTYALETGPVTDTVGNVSQGNQTDRGRVLEKAVREELDRRGLKPVDHNADITFLYSAARRGKEWGEQKWPYDKCWKYEEGAVDLMGSDRLGRTVWLAHLQAVIDPKDKNYSQLKKAIVKAFRKYPNVTQSAE